MTEIPGLPSHEVGGRAVSRGLRLGPIGLASMVALTLTGAVSASANSTLRVTVDACRTGSRFNPVPATPRVIGRVSVRDSQAVLHFEPNVLLVRSGDSPDSCLVAFDLPFTPALLESLLKEELTVRVEACGVPQGQNFAAAPGSLCGADDPAVLIADEPLSTLYDDVARKLSSYEATCPAGEALKSVNLGDSFECTPQLAFAADLAAESAKRASEDSALSAAVAAERTQRTAQVNAEAVNRSNGDVHGGDVSGPNYNLHVDPTRFQRRVTSTCGAGQAITAINENGSVTCAGDGGATYVTSLSLINNETCVATVPVVGTCTDYEYTATRTVNCNAGYTAMGGGYVVNKDRDFFVIENRSTGGSGWTVRVWSDYPDLTGSVTVTCLKLGS